ncbi:MAG: tRNA (adenosine(37)-N6)-threonylcarbamoyltransferase complex ATPase subunit type 1 TsaE [Gluconacetobacter diazotrophicus]|nr:tRNA (adenosine(37)-N6)-threonylcarbamoyltransferase complex ATPase subunit type 1 TsaE [Gluconacetobacter diazotrophicus]
MEAPLEFWLPDPPETERLGRALAAILRPGDAVLLEGPLGAGKSTLARALLRAACRNGRMEVPSPSFTLVQLYDGFDAAGEVLPVAHLDLWRLDGPGALNELGWDEALETGAVLVEWPDRLGVLRPADALEVALEPVFAAGAGKDAAGDADEEEAVATRRVRLRGWAGRLDAVRRAMEGEGNR